MVFISTWVVPGAMTPTKIRERLAECEGRIDPEEYVAALTYVRGGGWRRR